MLKDKNLQKAMELVADERASKEMSLEELVKMLLELRAAERAYNLSALAVKRHHNEVYLPMCEEKTELEVQMHVLRLRCEKAKLANPQLADLAKLVK